jgi:hypothetical protein
MVALTLIPLLSRWIFWLSSSGSIWFGRLCLGMGHAVVLFYGPPPLVFLIVQPRSLSMFNKAGRKVNPMIMQVVTPVAMM